MKTLAKTKTLASHRRRTTTRTRPAAPSAVDSAATITDEQFRRRLEIDLAPELAAARARFAKKHADLLRPLTPAEIKTRSARVRAMFAQREEENRKNPISREESASYDRMLSRMAAERAS